MKRGCHVTVRMIEMLNKAMPKKIITPVSCSRALWEEAADLGHSPSLLEPPSRYILETLSNALKVFKTPSCAAKIKKTTLDRINIDL